MFPRLETKSSIVAAATPAVVITNEDAADRLATPVEKSWTGVQVLNASGSAPIGTDSPKSGPWRDS
jgi:hypothetical protein